MDGGVLQVINRQARIWKGARTARSLPKDNEPMKAWNLTTNKVVAVVAAVCCWYHHLLPCAATELLQNDLLTPVFDNSQSCNDLYWLHPPKTSSTFCTTISHICCSSKFDLGVSTLKQNEPYKSRLHSGCSLPANLRQQQLACIGMTDSCTIPYLYTNLTICNHSLQDPHFHH